MRWCFRRGLRVLMYHKVAPLSDAHTVTPARLESQLRWLAAVGFHFVTAAEVVRAVQGAGLPAWPVLVTFDDAYADTFECARPVLRALRVPAVVFVPTAFVGRTSAWDADARPLMNASQLRALAAEGFELGLHSHRHENFAMLTAAQIADDVRENFAALRAIVPAPVPALAYPFGRRPSGAARATMRAALRECGVEAAFRIGNRINPLPPADPFDLNRIGVRGDASLWDFKRRIGWGRLF